MTDRKTRAEKRARRAERRESSEPRRETGEAETPQDDQEQPSAEQPSASKSAANEAALIVGSILVGGTMGLLWTQRAQIARTALVKAVNSETGQLLARAAASQAMHSIGGLKGHLLRHATTKRAAG